VASGSRPRTIDALLGALTSAGAADEGSARSRGRSDDRRRALRCAEAIRSSSDGPRRLERSRRARRMRAARREEGHPARTRGRGPPKLEPSSTTRRTISCHALRSGAGGPRARQKARRGSEAGRRGRPKGSSEPGGQPRCAADELESRDLRREPEVEGGALRSADDGRRFEDEVSPESRSTRRVSRRAGETVRR
jgi:hypothetical protein